ncbi:LITAF-like zinc ribbon domain-containing protein [Natronorubrum tibetense]|nr:LITAF-like zinc ribbon domain-containing protein [Natronorubrum tibetense]
MPYCTNCGGQVKDIHHYCGACGQTLSDIAESETDPPMAVDREGFLSLRSLSYVNNLLNGEQDLDRDSVSYTQLSREVSAAFADFARLAMIKDLDLLQLWAAGSSSEGLNTPVEDMSSNQFRDWLAAIGLSRTLRMYDESLHTGFEDDFNERLQKLLEIAGEELDS